MPKQETEERSLAKIEEPQESQELIILDSLDTELIVAELEGRVLTEWAYSFEDAGARVQGLTVAGIEECSRESAKHGEAIRIMSQDVKYLPEEEAYFAVVQAARFAVRPDGTSVQLDDSLGSKTEKVRKWSARKRAWYTVPNARDIALSKAVRNAKKKLLDSGMMHEVLERALAAGNVAQLPAERRQRAVKEAVRSEETPPPAEQMNEEAARRRFYAAASEAGLISQEALHAALVLGCGEGALHDAPKGADGCHALRELIQRFVSEGSTAAEAWDTAGRLLPGRDE